MAEARLASYSFPSEFPITFIEVALDIFWNCTMYSIVTIFIIWPILPVRTISLESHKEKGPTWRPYMSKWEGWKNVTVYNLSIFQIMHPKEKAGQALPEMPMALQNWCELMTETVLLLQNFVFLKMSNENEHVFIF